jgi:DNA-binding transcriptional LysR family regulator
MRGELTSAAPARLRGTGVSRRERQHQVSLTNLATFLAVARCGSEAEAAAFLDVSRAAVSLAVKRLERQLGVALLGGGRPKRLSDAGKLLFERVDPLFRELERRLKQPLQDQGSGNSDGGAPALAMADGLSV